MGSEIGFFTNDEYPPPPFLSRTGSRTPSNASMMSVTLDSFNEDSQSVVDEKPVFKKTWTTMTLLSAAALGVALLLAGLAIASFFLMTGPLAIPFIGLAIAGGGVVITAAMFGISIYKSTT